MKNLSLSLILVVVTAVIGLGWLITEIDYRSSRSQQEGIRVGDNAPDGVGLEGELAAYQALGRELALALDDRSDRQDFVRQWQAQSRFNIRLQTRAAFPVPVELAEDFESAGSLVLEADDNVSLHFLLPQSSQVLSLVIPDALAPDARPLTSLVLTLAFYGCVIATLLIWLYPLLRRLLLLARTAQAFGQGDLAARIALSRLSYIGDIEVEFNRMADRIQTLLDDNKLLSRAVSHNLKTPLARLRFGLDMLAETRDPALRQKYGQRISKDLREMESLVETLLQYARLDEATIHLQKRKLDLGTFVAELCAGREDSAVGIVCVPPMPDACIDADPTYLAILLNNIVDNALRHARSTVRITVVATPEGVDLSIEDDGAGIAVEDRSNVIKPFWRGHQEGPGVGHGMGLAIVARIAGWFDASLQIEASADLGGAAVHLHFHAAA